MTTDNASATSETSAESTPGGSRFHLNGIVVLLVGFFVLVIVVVQWQRVRLMEKLIDSAAKEAAKDHLQALATVRTVYTEEVVKVAIEHGIAVTHDYQKDGHSIPLPATLTMLIGNRIGDGGSGARTRLYSPFPFKWREAEGGLRDEFEKEAWEKLNAAPESSFSRIENSENGRVLRYAIADQMRDSCVRCHNEHPDSPRRGWKVGDVRGVLEVKLPLQKIEVQARRNLLESSLLMIFLAVIGGAVFLGTIFKLQQVTKARDMRVRELHVANTVLDCKVEERTALLRASEERFELAVRGSQDGLWDWNIPTNDVYFSPRFKELLGYTESELADVFETFESRLHPDDHDWVLAEITAHLQHLKPYDVKYRLQNKSGEYRWFRARGQAIWNATGQALRMAGSVTDVTEEHRLRERFRLAVEASPTALMMMHRDGRILLANSLTLTLFGYTEAELIGQPVEVLVPVRFRPGHPAHRNQFFQNPAQRAMGAELDLLGLRKDGSEFPVKVGLSPVETAEGQAVICGMIDITDQKQALEAMRQAKEAAEAANRAKSSFLANMSHEIRTPMNGIIGMSQLLARTELRSQQRDYLANVEESAHVLLRLLNDILDFSKIEAGKLELECVGFRVSECVARASQMLVLRAAEKGLEVACRVAPEIPDHLLGDPGRLQQVLVNLLGNAVKFTDAGEVFVNVNSESLKPESIRLHFSVSDTGIGIPAEKHAEIFHPFEQAEASTTRRFGGSGLGLTISRQLVEMMRGRIWLDSEPGRGSTFHFTAEFGVAADQQFPEPAELDSLQDLAVLVVDDNATNRRVLSELLQFWHMQPILADSAAAAREALRNAAESHRPIRLVLLDHHMPGEDGFHFLESVNGILNREQCPTIMISSGTTPVDADFCQKHGIDRFMTKPVIASELLNEILRQFGRRATVPSLASQSTVPAAPVLPRRVLLVEDNEINRRVALGMLRSRGHQVVVVENGQEAVNILAEQGFDVVLMDIQMPVLDGYEATVTIRTREHQTGGHVPIVAMTAEALKGDRERCLAGGMDGYVSKPIATSELYEAIERFPALYLADQGAVAVADPSLISSSPPAQQLNENQKPIIDWDFAKDRLQGGPEVMREFIVLAHHETQALAGEVRHAVEVRDFKVLCRAAHTIKGSVGYFGAERLAQAALALEQLGRTVSDAGIEVKLATLEVELTRFWAALESGPS